MNFNQKLLEEILCKYKDSGYKFISFHDEIEKERNVILRHDIDFDIPKALLIAELEEKLDISSTFFFLLRSDSYNFFEKKNIDAVMRISSLGHEISIHLDPTLYIGIEDGLRSEINLFRSVTGLKPRIISFHRPSEKYLNSNQNIIDLPHTYLDKFFKDINYIADSGGGFFYDHPVESQSFEKQLSLQLLIHPIWWTTEGETNIDKIKNYLKTREEKFSKHFARNCKPWNNFLTNKK
tara:strand:+ start:801 stop:1511 length:711 start_codon:yes stop_codon:yes gene_type:complete